MRCPTHANASTNKCTPAAGSVLTALTSIDSRSRLAHHNAWGRPAARHGAPGAPLGQQQIDQEVGEAQHEATPREQPA